VIITTGQNDATSRVRGSLAGCDAFLGKPLIEADLVAALREVDPLFQ
jgi:DNA-binding response OmpR family regulator